MRKGKISFCHALRGLKLRGAPWLRVKMTNLAPRDIDQFCLKRVAFSQTQDTENQGQSAKRRMEREREAVKKMEGDKMNEKILRRKMRKVKAREGEEAHRWRFRKQKVHLTQNEEKNVKNWRSRAMSALICSLTRLQASPMGNEFWIYKLIKWKSAAFWESIKHSAVWAKFANRGPRVVKGCGKRRKRIKIITGKATMRLRF